MSFNAYSWTKDKLDEFTRKINSIKNDGLKNSEGDIWSIKKFFIIDYLIGGFVPIYRKYFKNWYFVDTHCGAGLIDFNDRLIKDVRFPGTSIIAAFNATKYEFTNYYMSDIDSDSVQSLKQRLKALGALVGSRAYNPEVREFSDTVQFLNKRKQFGNIFLIVIDPAGFKEIHWDLMTQILSIEKAEIIFTFMTHGIARHRSNVKPDNNYAVSLDKFYGNNNWQQHTSGQKLMELYRDQINQLKKHVYDIPVFQSGHVLSYHILIATDNDTASNIIDDARKISRVQTELIDGALKIVTNKVTPLEKWCN